MKPYIKEIGLFLKKYLKSIIIGTIAIALVFSGFIILQNQLTEENTPYSETSAPSETTETSEFTPYNFRFYMKLPDGYSFQNEALMDEILNSPITYELLDESVSFDVSEYFTSPIEDEETEEIEEVEATEEDRFRFVDVNIDSNSNVFTLIIEVGDANRNAEITDFYYNTLLNEELEVLEANEVFILNEPGIIEEGEFEQEFYEDFSESYVQPSLIDAWDIIIALTFALFMMLLVSLLREVFNKTLNFSFAYHTGDSYDSLLFDKTNDNPELVRYFVGSPKHTKKILLSEKPLSDEMTQLLESGNEITLKADKSDQIYAKNLTTLSDYNLTDDVQEVVVFVNGNETTRQWYKDEINYSRVLKMPVRTVHFMVEKDS